MNRLVIPDLLKGLAAFFMVQVHITELFMSTSVQESLVGKISMFLGGPFAAVVFMLVMGYFIALGKGGFWSGIVRSVKVFLLALLLNIGLNFNLFLKIFYQEWQYNPLQYVFGVDILFLASFSIFILATIKLSGKYQLVVAAILLIAIAVLSSFINPWVTNESHGYLLPFVGGEYSWSYFPMFPWLIYPLAGFIFGKSEKRILSFTEKYKKPTLLAIVAALLFVVLYFKQGFAITINLPLYYHHSGWYILWALALTGLWILGIRKLAAEISETASAKIIIRIGKNITAFYVVQWLIIGNLATEIFGSQLLITFPFWVAGIFSLSVLITFSYERLMKLIKKPKQQTA